MKHTLICMVTHRGLSDGPTRECVRQLALAGAELITASRVSDVASGRSALLTAAITHARKGGRDTLLLVDDDMVFTVADAETLVDHVRTTGRACSAVYPTYEGGLAAQRYQGSTWLTGLGFFAVGVDELDTLGRTLPEVRIGRAKGRAYCESRAMPETGDWCSEDFDLCRKLGGVDLLPIAVGHIKQVPLYADQVTLTAIINNEPLAADLPLTGQFNRGRAAE